MRIGLLVFFPLLFISLCLSLATAEPLLLQDYFSGQRKVLTLPPETRDDDLKQLSLKRFSRVTDIILTSTQITDAGLEHLSHLPLDKLYLTNTEIGDKALGSVAKLTSLTQLSLNGTKVTDNGLSLLVGLPIERLYLNDTMISDAGMKYVSKLPLQTLYLANTKVTDLGLGHLKELPIQAINVAGTAVGDSSIPLLKSLPLEKAFFRSSGVSSEKARELVAVGVLIDF